MMIESFWILISIFGLMSILGLIRPLWSADQSERESNGLRTGERHIEVKKDALGERSPQRSYAGIVLTGLVLSLAFILLLLIIVNLPITEAAESTTEAGFWDQIRWIFTTRRSNFLYEILLAGMLGAYLGEIVRIAGITPPAEPPISALQFEAALFLGGAAAITSAVLIPLVVLGRFEGPDINSWTLVAVAGIIGNRARDAFSRIENTIAHLLASFEPHLDTAKISESVKTSIHEAFAVPPPVNYEGFLAMDVTHSNESVVGSEETNARVARLRRGEMFELRVQFAPDSPLMGRGVIKAIRVRGGDDQQIVPFRLLVDFGFVEVFPEERRVSVPRRSASAMETFNFVVPLLEGKSPPPGRGHSESTPPEVRRPEISVSVYQHARYFDSLVLPVTVPS
jgi:hypothetical protein